LGRLAENPPLPIPILVRGIDFAERANHARELLSALSDYLGALLDETAANVPGGLDLRQIEALLCDLTSEVTGTLVNAEALAEVVP
jgi:hypothetical protein